MCKFCKNNYTQLYRWSRKGKSYGRFLDQYKIPILASGEKWKTTSWNHFQKPEKLDTMRSKYCNKLVTLDWVKIHSCKNNPKEKRPLGRSECEMGRYGESFNWRSEDLYRAYYRENWWISCTRRDGPSGRLPGVYK